jgi:hypothetical protein
MTPRASRRGNRAGFFLDPALHEPDQQKSPDHPSEQAERIGHEAGRRQLPVVGQNISGGGIGQAIVGIAKQRRRKQDQESAVGQGLADLAQRLAKREMDCRTGIEPGDPAVGGQRGNAGCGDQQRGAGPAIELIPVDIELADRVAL